MAKITLVIINIVPDAGGKHNVRLRRVSPQNVSFYVDFWMLSVFVLGLFTGWILRPSRSHNNLYFKLNPSVFQTAPLITAALNPEIFNSETETNVIFGSQYQVRTTAIFD